MNRTLHNTARFLCAALLAGCFGENDTWYEGDTSGMTRHQPSETVADTLPRTLEGDMPIVLVKRSGNVRGTYVYCLQGEEYQEGEFLGLCRSMLRDKPSLHVNFIPADTLNQDEIGLVAARIRETGVEHVATVDKDGRVR